MRAYAIAFLILFTWVWERAGEVVCEKEGYADATYGMPHDLNPYSGRKRDAYMRGYHRGFKEQLHREE